MKKNPNLVLAEQVAVAILNRIHTNPNFPIYKNDLDSLELCSEAFRIAHKELKRRGEGGCDFLRQMILGLGNQKLKIKHNYLLLPESVKAAIVGKVLECS